MAKIHEVYNTSVYETMFKRVGNKIFTLSVKFKYNADAREVYRPFFSCQRNEPTYVYIVYVCTAVVGMVVATDSDYCW